MEDISIWVHGPEFGSSATQIAILEEILKKKPEIKININVVERNKEIFDFYYAKQIKERAFSVQSNKLIHQLNYSRSMNLSLAKTFASVTKNLFSKSLPFILQFNRRVYKNRPKLIVSQGLAEVGLLSKLMKKPRPPTLYLFNYLLEYSKFLKIPILPPITRKLFIMNYANYDYPVIQTFFPEKNYRIKKELSNLIMTHIIARNPTATKHQIRKDLGVKANEKLIFLAMGGAKYFGSIVKITEEITKEHPEIKFLLLPRKRDEISLFKNLKDFIVPNEITFETQNYVGASDVVITKCGFSTIAEAIKCKTNIISVHLPNHPEVTETEILLKNIGIIKNSIKFSNFMNGKKVKNELYKKIASEIDNKESLKIMGNIKTNGAEQASNIYLKILENGC